MKKIIALITLFFVFISSAYAARVESINAIDNKTIEVVTSPEVIFSDNKIYGDVKVLRDIRVGYSSKDFENHKKIILNLSSDLYANTSYNIFTVIWAEWSIDFTIWDFTPGEIKNDFFTQWAKDIEKINIIDSRTIEIYYSYDIEEDDFEFKILSELKIDNLSSSWDNILTINMENTLDSSTPYIVMLNSLEDISWNRINLWETLFDITTSSNLVEKVESEEKEVIKEIEVDEWNIEEVALNSAETPDTWAETWVLIMLTFIFSSFYFLRNKFQK